MISNTNKLINDSTELDGEQNTHKVSCKIKEIVIEWTMLSPKDLLNLLYRTLVLLEVL